MIVAIKKNLKFSIIEEQIMNRCEVFTKEELLSIFKLEAQYICKRSDEVASIADSTLNDFIKYHHKYVQFV
jgi:hypothetical protein